MAKIKPKINQAGMRMQSMEGMGKSMSTAKYDSLGKASAKSSKVMGKLKKALSKKGLQSNYSK